MRLSRADAPFLYTLTPNRGSASIERDVFALVRGGARWIQIREKGISDRDIIRIGSRVVASMPHDVSLFANDRIDLAIGMGARGVHLGDRDFPPDLARRIVGDGLIIGVSTHSVAEAIQMSKLECVDYVAIGPIFPSETKMVRDPLGIRAVESARERIEKPIVAIGGIDSTNIGSVIRAGADSAAVIAALYENGSIEDNVRKLIDRAREGRG